jgi:preprotein translocase subunit YajC
VAVVAEILPFVLVIVVFWFLLIRPQQRRMASMRAMQYELSVGDRVTLTSGIYGTIVELDDDRAHIEIAEGVVIEVVRAAVGGLADDVVDEETLGVAPELEEN